MLFLTLHPSTINHKTTSSVILKNLNGKISFVFRHLHGKYNGKSF